jgi:DNA-binding CsgD family transcriptional regulator
MMREPRDLTQRELEASDRFISVVLMRQSGLSFSQIARSLGVSRSRAQQIYRLGSRSRAARWVWFKRMMSFNQRLRDRRNGIAIAEVTIAWEDYGGEIGR